MGKILIETWLCQSNSFHWGIRQILLYLDTPAHWLLQILQCIFYDTACSCCDPRTQPGTWLCWTSDNWPWSIDAACPDPSSRLQFRKFIFSILFFFFFGGGNHLLHPGNWNCTCLGQLPEQTHTESLLSWVRSLFESTRWDSGFWIQKVSFFQTCEWSCLLHLFTTAVCKSVLLRGKELWFWSKSNCWWGLELHNLALQSKQMGAYSVLIRLSVILIPFSSVRWVLWTCCDWLETDYSASNPRSTPVVWKVC